MLTDETMQYLQEIEREDQHQQGSQHQRLHRRAAVNTLRLWNHYKINETFVIPYAISEEIGNTYEHSVIDCHCFSIARK